MLKKLGAILSLSCGLNQLSELCPPVKKVANLLIVAFLGYVGVVEVRFLFSRSGLKMLGCFFAT